MNKCRNGFSLLELMVVVAIMGILGMMAIPSYMHRIARQQILDAMPLADIAKKPVVMAWALAQPLPHDNAAAGLPAHDLMVSNLVQSLAVEDGAIQITFGNKSNGMLNGKLLTLRPAVIPDAPIVPVAWVCGYADGPGKMTVKGENKTDIPEEFLPVACRRPPS